MPATILDLCVHIYVYMIMQVMFCYNHVHVSFCVMLYYSLGSKSTKPEGNSQQWIGIIMLADPFLSMIKVKLDTQGNTTKEQRNGTAKW